jgi:peptidoglycan/xylan/chitin deacetylase (PgdA/CDA1 family)
MEEEQSMGRNWRRYAIAAAVVTGAGVVGIAPPAGSVVPLGQPAFYTWQAPYGEATAGQRVVALTFDDGPSIYTPQVMAVLEQYHVPATFFEVGYEVAAHPTMSADLAAAGFSVQNHTWDHPNLATLPVSQYPFEIDQTQNMITSVMGRAPICVRPPYDAWSGTTLQQLAIRGLTTMSYSVDSSDYKRPGVQAIVNAVVGSSFPGAVIGLHDGGGDRSQTVAALPQIISQLSAQGYGFVSLCQAPAPPPPPPPPPPQTSAVYAFGTAPVPGAPATTQLRFTGLAADPVPGGYWLSAAEGGVFSYAGAPFLGSLPGLGITPALPVAAMAASPTGQGYWMTGADGGIFTFGDAGFYGSMGAKPLNRPVVGMAGTPDGKGYWEVASDGGVFTFGDAGFFGSMGAKPLNQPVVGIASTPDGQGYWEVASDGGVFAFGDAAFHGSMGGTPLNRPVTGLASDAATGGYWMVSTDGGVFAFDAPFYGSRGGAGGPDRFYAIASTSGGAGYLLAGQHDA